MPRPRTPIGTFGDIYFENAANGKVRAFTRYRDEDGRLRRVAATRPTQKSAELKLKQGLTERAHHGDHTSGGRVASECPCGEAALAGT